MSIGSKSSDTPSFAEHANTCKLVPDMETQRPRKRFGQNFLQDSQIIDRIVQDVAPRPTDHLVEIGPGRGALTRVLQPHCAQLDIIELDRDLIDELHDEFDHFDNVRIHSADALKFDFQTLVRPTDSAPGPPRALQHALPTSQVAQPLPGQKMRVVANLPYNISTAILFRMLEQITLFEDFYLMLQREVVERIVAAPGSSGYSRLTVMLGLHCHAEQRFSVPPTAFFPVPKVVSTLVRLVPHEQPLQPEDFPRFQAIVAQAFSQRRKTLRNSLRGQIAPEEMADRGINPTRRPQTLALTEFITLSECAPVTPE
ncbi:MAG: 16S rRNA (adenine1518-N6/adenine1519-N6)-dimethyltransferase [Gammaproteobacteria bacterium]